MDSTVLDLTTGTDRLHDVTRRVQQVLDGFDADDGIAQLFLPHATAGLALVETGAGSDDDLAAQLDEWLPRDDRWRHSHGSPGHGADHVLPVLVSPSLSVPVMDGRMMLGTWQSVVVVDTNVDNPRRQLRVSYLRG